MIIPAAGKGRRFAPFSTAVPKELLPILGRPTIDYILEEIALAGLEHIVAVVSDTKKPFEDYLAHYWLSRDEFPNATVAFTRQFSAKGLGHAVWVARTCVHDDLVVVVLPDNLFLGGISPLIEMCQLARTHQATIIAVEEVPTDAVSNYGIIAPGNLVTAGCLEIRDIIEKPSADKAPSHLAVVGRYILSTDIFTMLEKTSPGINGELQLTDGIKTLIRSGKPVFSYQIRSTFLDIGTPSSWLQANLSVAAAQQQKMPKISSF